MSPEIKSPLPSVGLRRVQDVQCSAEELQFVRAEFMTEVSSHPDLYDVLDVDRVQHDEWTVKRFIVFKKYNLKEATDALISNMRWRKEHNVIRLRKKDFPSEFFSIAEFHPYVRDRNNMCTVYTRVKFHRKFEELASVGKGFLIFVLEQMDNAIRSGADGCGLIEDCTGGSLFNNDMEMLRFSVELMFTHYPLLMSYIGLHQMPWVLKAIYHLCRAWFPSDFQSLFIFLDKSNLDQVIGYHNLPPYMEGGTCTTGFSHNPVECKSILDPSLQQMWSYDEKVSTKFVSYYRDILQKVHSESEHLSPTLNLLSVSQPPIREERPNREKPIQDPINTLDSNNNWGTNPCNNNSHFMLEA